MGNNIHDILSGWLGNNLQVRWSRRNCKTVERGLAPPTPVTRSSNAMSGHSPELEFRGSQAVEVDPGEPNSGGSFGNMVPSSNAVSGHGPEIEYCRGSQAV